MSLANDSSILFIFSKNQLLFLLIFAIVSFISFSFISNPIFMFSFLLLTFFQGEYMIQFLKNFYLFIYFWLCSVFVSVHGLSLVAVSGGHSSSWCTGLSLSRPLLLRSASSRHAGSVVVAHRPCCSTACGIFPDQGSNPFPQH